MMFLRRLAHRRTGGRRFRAPERRRVLMQRMLVAALW
jgi:hypothetical protein